MNAETRAALDAAVARCREIAHPIGNHDTTEAQMRRRHAAALRLPPLDNGVRDPLAVTR